MAGRADNGIHSIPITGKKVDEDDDESCSPSSAATAIYVCGLAGIPWRDTVGVLPVSLVSQIMLAHALASGADMEWSDADPEEKSELENLISRPWQSEQLYE